MVMIKKTAQFIEDSRKYIVQNKHDGLMFFLSSHGDRDNVLYGSQCEMYQPDID